MELIGCWISINSIPFNCNVRHLIIEAMIPCQAPTWLQILVVRCIHILGFVYLTNTYVIHVISAQSSLFNPSCTKFSCIKCIALSKPPTYKLSNKPFPVSTPSSKYVLYIGTWFHSENYALSSCKAATR